MSSKVLNIINDEPITGLDQDSYRYKDLAQEIARCISAADASTSSFTISLNGLWGSGKTSLINLIEVCLNEERKRNLNVPALVRFNPWRFESQEQLLTGFFQLLKESLLGKTGCIKDTEKKALGEALSLYSASISYPTVTEVTSLLAGPLPSAVAGGGIVGKWLLKVFTSKIGKYLTNSTSLDHVKTTIDGYLKERQTNIVVVIDDIDRLSDAEICHIFKLVTLTASFPHIVYLLSFDRTVVENALCNVQRADGAAYLDKIIQLPIEMPRLFQSDISQQINIIAEDLQKRSPFALEDQDHLSDVSNKIISPLINTPRDICRIKNCAESNFARLRNDICVADLFALSTIQTLLPDVYCWLWNNARYLFGETYTKNETGLKAELREELSRLINKQIRHYALNPGWLGTVFPSLSENSNSEALNSVDAGEAYIHGRISNRNLFNLYFGAGYSAGITREQFNAICNHNSAFEIRDIVCALRSSNEQMEIAGQLMLTVRSLDIERCKAIAQGSLLIISSLSPLIATSSRDVRESFSRLFNTSAARIGKPGMGTWLISLMNDNKTLKANCLLYLLRDENLSRNREESPDNQLLTDKQFADLARLFSNWMSCNYRSCLESADRDLFTMWKAMDAIFDFCNWAEFEQNLSKDPECNLLYSSQQMACWTSLSSTPSSRFELRSSANGILSNNYIQTIWQQEWYPRLSETAKLFLAAFCLATNAEKGSRSSTIHESEAVKLVRNWDSLLNGWRLSHP